MAPDWVSSLSPSTRLARPKSVTWGCPSRVEQDVGRLQVAVEDAALVGVVDGRRRRVATSRGDAPGIGGVVRRAARRGCRRRSASC